MSEQQVRDVCSGTLALVRFPITPPINVWSQSTVTGFAKGTGLLSPKHLGGAGGLTTKSKEQSAWVAACARGRCRRGPDKIHPKPLGAWDWVGHMCCQASPDSRHSHG